MRFTPAAFFGSGDTESCISVRGTGAVSESFSCNGVNWDVLMYSCSLQSGGSTTGSGVEDFEFYVDSGTTKHAVVAVVGAGGAGSSDGNGGGGGEVKVLDNILLTETISIPYQISIGRGGSGTYRITPGLSFSGENGKRSYFRGYGVDITCAGGDGGTYGGDGGDSGNGNTTTDSGGAGAASGSDCIQGGSGFTIYKNLSGGDKTKMVRAGGGGEGETGAACSYNHEYKEFGGGNDDGKGGQSRNGVKLYGGGAKGGQYYNVITERYFSHAGGGGFVMVAVPTNLCTASLYSKSDIVLDNLVSNYSADNAISFGKNFLDTQYKDTQRVTNLTTTSTPGYTNVDDLLLKNYTGSIPIMSYNDILKVEDRIEYAGGISKGLDYSLTGSLPLITSNGFTFEYYGTIGSAAGAFNTEVMRIDGTNDSDITLYRERSGLGGEIRVRYKDGITSNLLPELSLDENLHQHNITFDGTTLKWYVDAREYTSLITSVTSSLDNPTFTLFNRQDEEYFVSSSRVYSEALSATQISQNYAGNSDIVIAQPTPGAVVNTFVFDTGSYYTADSQLPTFSWVTSSLTLEVWSNDDGSLTGTYDVPIGLNDQVAGGDRDFIEVRYRNHSGNKLYGNNFDGSSDNVTQPYGANVSLSGWYHSILTWDSGSGEMLYYRDGTLIGSASVPTITTELNNPYYHIGKTDLGVADDMYIGEYRIYPFALNASQSLYNYNQTENRYI